MFIFKSSSSSSYLHLQVIFILIWIIITKSRSSVGHHHRCYLLILLVIGSSTEPTLFHVGCRPSLHVGLFQHLYLTLSQNVPPSTYNLLCRNQSYNHSTHISPCGNTSHNPIRNFQHSHLTMRGTNLVIYVRKAQHLHSTMRGTNPTYMLKGICTYIWSCRNQSYNHLRMALHLHLIM